MHNDNDGEYLQQSRLAITIDMVQVSFVFASKSSTHQHRKRSLSPATGVCNGRRFIYFEKLDGTVVELSNWRCD